AYNVRSVGIENEGVTDDPSGFTNAQYRATAKLAAVIARRALIPIDRRHIIGHYQVPDPNDPLQGGGIDNHTDPGKFWRWGYFMNLVERFAYPQKYFRERHVGLQIQSSTLYDGQTVAGAVPWRTKVGGPVNHVSFYVDGKERWTDRIGPYAFAGGRPLNTFGLRNGKHVLLYVDRRLVDHDTSAPYAFKWDTRRVKDGTHTVTLAGRARDGRVVRSSVSVSVVNGQMQPAKIVSTSIADGQTVSGLQHWLADVGGSVKKVEFVVDGTVRGTETKAPYSYDWDTAAETPGAHELVVRATGADGTVSEQTARRR